VKGVSHEWTEATQDKPAASNPYPFVESNQSGRERTADQLDVGQVDDYSRSATSADECVTKTLDIRMCRRDTRYDMKDDDVRSGPFVAPQ
jgi:hypothetical protein